MSRTGLLEALAAADHILVDLARPMYAGMPHSPTHPGFTMTLRQHHGEVTRADRITGSHEEVSFGGHVGTHMDALCHVAVDGEIFGGVPVDEALVGGRYVAGGIDQVAPFVGRAVFFDVPALTGRTSLDPGEPVSATDLAAAAGPVQLRPGDAALVRTGWGSRWPDGYDILDGGVPGLTLDAARWLSGQRVVLVGGDTLALEQVHPDTGHARLPVHRHLLGECGVNIVETLALEELSNHGVRELVLICAPLNVLGATGAPVRPLALIPGR